MKIYLPTGLDGRAVLMTLAFGLGRTARKNVTRAFGRAGLPISYWASAMRGYPTHALGMTWAKLKLLIFRAWYSHSMMQSYRKMSKMLEALSFFLTFEFEFCIENTKKLYAQMSPVDRQVFHFDVDSINWDQYSRVSVAGIKKYLLGESDAQIDKDRTRFKRYYSTSFENHFVENISCPVTSSVLIGCT